jgi:hypothetical protein
MEVLSNLLRTDVNNEKATGVDVFAHIGRRPTDSFEFVNTCVQGNEPKLAKLFLLFSNITQEEQYDVQSILEKSCDAAASLITQFSTEVDSLSSVSQNLIYSMVDLIKLFSQTRPNWLPNRLHVSLPMVHAHMSREDLVTEMRACNKINPDYNEPTDFQKENGVQDVNDDIIITPEVYNIVESVESVSLVTEPEVKWDLNGTGFSGFSVGTYTPKDEIHRIAMCKKMSLDADRWKQRDQRANTYIRDYFKLHKKCMLCYDYYTLAHPGKTELNFCMSKADRKYLMGMHIYWHYGRDTTPDVFFKTIGKHKFFDSDKYDVTMSTRITTIMQQVVSVKYRESDKK